MGDASTEGWVRVPGGRLWFEASGHGPAVVLLHSGLVDSGQWDDHLHRFAAEGFMAVRYDLRGYGRSDRPVGPYRASDDLVALLDQLRIDRAALVGSSYGGRVALDLALERPDRIRALVLVAAAASGFSGWDDGLRAMWRRQGELADAGDLEGAQDLELDHWCPPGRLPGDERIRALARANLHLMEMDDPEEDLDPPAIGRLGEVRPPTLVVSAELDVPSFEELGRRLAMDIPGARSVAIPASDHLINLRNPEAFDRAVLDFLRDTVGG